jgi:type VI secretion system protein ImpC
MERWLNSWILNYVIDNPEDAGDELRARHPLRAAQISVTEVKGKPGYYQAVAHLRPHFQLEGLNTSMRLVAELPQQAKK